MKRFFLYFQLIPILLLLRCAPHKSFVATPYEPLLVDKKNDLQISAGIRPFKYYSAEVTYAPTNSMAVRASVGGFLNLLDLQVSVPFFKNTETKTLFIAPAFSYQHNTINRSFGIPLGNKKTYRYNCEYVAPGIVLGLTFKQKNEVAHHIIFKTQYNLVQRYEYYFNKNNNSGKSSSFMVLDNETLIYDLPDFFSFEPGYAYTASISKHLFFKFQASFNICQTVLKHYYLFQRGDYSNPYMQEGSTFHPVTRYFNISFSLMFKGNLKKAGN